MPSRELRALASEAARRKPRTPVAGPQPRKLPGWRGRSCCACGAAVTGAEEANGPRARLRGWTRDQQRVTEQNSHFDVAIERRLGEVRGSKERKFSVHDEHLGVEDTPRTLRFNPTRVVKHPRPSRARPVRAPEPIREASYQILCLGGVPTFPLYVQHQGHGQFRGRVHPSRQQFEGPRTVEEGIGGEPHGLPCSAQRLL